MLCSKCQTHFCWQCLEICAGPNPYLHFEKNPTCWNTITSSITDNEDIVAHKMNG